MNRILSKLTNVVSVVFVGYDLNVLVKVTKQIMEFKSPSNYNSIKEVSYK